MILDPRRIQKHDTNSFFFPTRIHVFVENASSFRSTPSPGRAATTSKALYIRVAMDTFVVNVVVWILIWPEFVLSIDSIEADVRCVALTVGKSSNLASPVCCGAVDINAY